MKKRNMPSESLTVIHKSCRVKIENSWWESNKHFPKMKSITNIAEITNEKNEKYLPEGRNSLACSPACLLARVFHCLPAQLLVCWLISWDSLMFYQILFSSQVKRCAIITYKHGIYELPHELPNDLRQSTLGN